MANTHENDDAVKATVTVEFSAPLGVIIKGLEKTFGSDWASFWQIAKMVTEGVIVYGAWALLA